LDGGRIGDLLVASRRPTKLAAHDTTAGHARALEKSMHDQQPHVAMLGMVERFRNRRQHLEPERAPQCHRGLIGLTTALN
jgi:hypothetical protein